MEESNNRDGIISSIVAIEWDMFQKVNEGKDRASCQNDPETFNIMRKAQYAAWSTDTIVSYLRDLTEAQNIGRNLVLEKYAYMMLWTNPEMTDQLLQILPPIEDDKKAIVDDILAILMEQTKDFAANYPNISGAGRPTSKDDDDKGFTSVETYQRCELYTYSTHTLRTLYTQITKLAQEGISYVKTIREATAHAYGYTDLDEAEAAGFRG